MDTSQFSILFAQSADIYGALDRVISASRMDGGMIDPVEVVRELTSHFPDAPLPPAALLEEVVRAATVAGLSLEIGASGIEAT